MSYIFVFNVILFVEIKCHCTNDTRTYPFPCNIFLRMKFLEYIVTEIVLDRIQSTCLNIHQCKSLLKILKFSTLLNRKVSISAWREREKSLTIDCTLYSTYDYILCAWSFQQRNTKSPWLVIHVSAPHLKEFSYQALEAAPNNEVNLTFSWACHY